MGLSSDLTSPSLALASVVAVSCLTVLTSPMAASCFADMLAFSEGFISFKNSDSSL